MTTPWASETKSWCPVCGRFRPTRSHGTLMAKHVNPKGKVCKGTGRPPVRQSGEPTR